MNKLDLSSIQLKGRSVGRSRRNTGVQGRNVVPQGGSPLEALEGVWSDCSKAYAEFADAVTVPFAEDAIRLVRMMPGGHVLDVATGTGAFALAAARSGAQVLATDFSPGMVRHVYERSAGFALRNIQTGVMDGQSLDLADGTFDVAASLFGLMFFPDHKKGLSELHRVVRAGGQGVVATWAPPARVELMRILGEAAMQAEIDPPASEGVPYWVELCDERRLRAHLEAVGFKKVHVVTVVHVSVFDDAEQIAKLLPTSTPSSAALFASLTEQERKRFLAVLVADFHERQGAGPYAFTSEALIAVGTK